MIVATTGIILILFVIGHLLGNLQIFLGPDWINGYAQHLRDLGPLLWMIRTFLLVTVVAHIYYTIRLAIENRRARPEHYRRRDIVRATLASRTMVMGGLVLLVFIIYHLLHFTFRTTDPRFLSLPKDPAGHYDVYSMMENSFRRTVDHYSDLNPANRRLREQVAQLQRRIASLEAQTLDAGANMPG